MWRTAEAGAWQELPRTGWKAPRREVKGLEGQHLVAIGYPRRKDGGLSFVGERAWPAGLYRLRLVLRPSHVAAGIAFNGGLKVLVGDETVASFGGLHFARVHQPETRELSFVHRREGAVEIGLQTFADAKICEEAFTAAKLKAGGPSLDVALGTEDKDADDESEGIDDLVYIPAPGKAFYYMLDRAEIRPVSHSGRVSNVWVNKIRYEPGETLHGVATLEDVGGRGGKGTLSLYLEHDVNTRAKVKDLPVTLRNEPEKIEFEIKLPDREFGHALVAVYTSDDGRDVSEAAEYFNIAENFFRVAIHGNIGGHGHTKRTPEQMRAAAAGSRPDYINCAELFAWAEEDMVEMSSETDWWFSGQTNYHLCKKGLQNFIRIAHEQGISVVTYGKFIMSGYLGWKTAYDYPNDHKGQYFYPVGMWEGTDVLVLDRFRNKEFVPYANRPHARGERVFDVWWSQFMPINPDHTPRMARIAAEEVIRSIEMFGWDAIRWDGHPRGGGACGGAGKYNYLAARRTQTLVRYFKDIVSGKYPKFRHGYNYLFTQKEPSYDWAYEDFELDELCRGGGLLMNESIRNSAGKPFEWIARNVQVEGDLCRERGGYLLGISCDGASPRDVLVEQILYVAGGCRPMGGAAAAAKINRYATRYSRYTLDETLRRLDRPDGILKPLTETKLWWQPFAYETRTENSRKQLVVNLLNVPRKEWAKREGDTRIDWDLCAGTDPVTFRLELPDDHRARAAHLVDPFTLEVTTTQLSEAEIMIPPVAVWKVLIVDLDVAEDAKPLAERYGCPRTFGVKRKEVAAERIEPLTLDVTKSVVEVNKDMSHLSPRKRPRGAPESDLDRMTWDKRNEALLARKAKNSPQSYIKGWWKGGSLPHDLKLKNKEWDFGDLSPVRNGVMDIFYGRGAIDYRLRMMEVLAGIGRFQVHDAPLAGVFRQNPGQYLRNGISWREFPNYDLLLYTAIPHCAIGIENSYALPEYVKAGGAVFISGGEYAFGKGGYEFTVLERELLPVLCTETVDTRYPPEPLVIEPAKDFGQLNVEVDFSAKPSFWTYNQVALKDRNTIRIFLKCGNRPVLVGWQLGKGRVACLLLDHRGKSEGDVTAFFDWRDWPKLVRAVIAWLAPGAGHEEKRVRAEFSKERLAQVREQLETTMFEGDMELEEDEDDEDSELTALPGEATGKALSASACELEPARLKERIAAIDEVLRGAGLEISALLADQLASVTNLPTGTRDAIIDFVRQCPPPQLAEIANRCVKDANSSVRSCGHQLLAIAGSAGFGKELKAQPGAFETDRIGRERYLAIALVMYPKGDLRGSGREKVRAWNASEAEVKARWTDGGEFSLGAPAHPCLDAESLFQRIAWLAYLSRQESGTYATQFAREWLMTAQYQDYCDRSVGNLWGMNMSAADRKRAIILTKEWRILRSLFARLRSLTQPDLQRLFRTHRGQVAAGFARAHFTLEARQCINFLGLYPAGEVRPVLQTLGSARQFLLANFAEARLRTAPQD